MRCSLRLTHQAPTFSTSLIHAMLDVRACLVMTSALDECVHSSTAMQCSMHETHAMHETHCSVHETRACVSCTNPIATMHQTHARESYRLQMTRVTCVWRACSQAGGTHSKSQNPTPQGSSISSRSHPHRPKRQRPAEQQQAAARRRLMRLPRRPSAVAALQARPLPPSRPPRE